MRTLFLWIFCIAATLCTGCTGAVDEQAADESKREPEPAEPAPAPAPTGNVRPQIVGSQIGGAVGGWANDER